MNTPVDVPPPRLRRPRRRSPQRTTELRSARRGPFSEAVLLAKLLGEANGVGASLYQLACHAHSAKLPCAEEIDAAFAGNHQMVDAVLEELMLWLTE